MPTLSETMSAPHVQNGLSDHGDISLQKGTRMTRSGRCLVDVDVPASKNHRLIREFFHKEPCLFNHMVFSHAGQVFQALRKDFSDESQPPSFLRGKTVKPYIKETKSKDLVIPHIDFHSETEKRLTFELAFSALKYQKLLEDVLDECAFFAQYPEFKEDQSVATVMLWDLQNRKFQRRFPGPEEEILPILSEIEDALWHSRTKMNAALARNRIKANALSLDHLLPEKIRMKDKEGTNEIIYAWVNQIKTNMSTVTDQLKDEGFTEVSMIAELKGPTFYMDVHCSDLLAFPANQRDFLTAHMLVEEGHVVLQDKSSCLGAQSVAALVNGGEDVLHINVGSGLTTAHLASLIYQSDSQIFAVGIKSEHHLEEVQARLEKYGAHKYVKVMQEAFLDIPLDDVRMKHIKTVLVSAECSKTGITNPVDFIVNEGEDMGILRDLAAGEADDSRLGEIVAKQTTLLKHAMRYGRVQAIVYCTHSVNVAENDNVVTRSIEYINTIAPKKNTPFRVSPPVIPLTEEDIDSDQQTVHGKFLFFPPSPRMSGCFIAIIAREADDPKEAAKDILARAAAKGLLGAATSDKPEKPEKSKSHHAGDKPPKDKSAKLRKRAARSPRRIRSSSVKNAPGRVTSVVSTPVRTLSRRTAARSMPRMPQPPSMSVSERHAVTSVRTSPHIAVTTRLFPAPVIDAETESRRRARLVAPHQAVLRHPAPFRSLEKNKTDLVTDLMSWRRRRWQNHDGTLTSVQIQINKTTNLHTPPALEEAAPELAPLETSRAAHADSMAADLARTLPDSRTEISDDLEAPEESVAKMPMPEPEMSNHFETVPFLFITGHRNIVERPQTKPCRERTSQTSHILRAPDHDTTSDGHKFVKTADPNQNNKPSENSAAMPVSCWSQCGEFETKPTLVDKRSQYFANKLQVSKTERLGNLQTAPYLRLNGPKSLSRTESARTLSALRKPQHGRDDFAITTDPVIKRLARFKKTTGRSKNPDSSVTKMVISKTDRPEDFQTRTRTYEDLQMTEFNMGDELSRNDLTKISQSKITRSDSALATLRVPTDKRPADLQTPPSVQTGEKCEDFVTRVSISKIKKSDNFQTTKHVLVDEISPCSWTKVTIQS